MGNETDDKVKAAVDKTEEVAGETGKKAAEGWEAVEEKAKGVFGTIGSALKTAGEAVVETAEKVTHKDLDKDGKVGE